MTFVHIHIQWSDSRRHFDSSVQEVKAYTLKLVPLTWKNRFIITSSSLTTTQQQAKATAANSWESLEERTIQVTRWYIRQASRNLYVYVNLRKQEKLFCPSRDQWYSGPLSLSLSKVEVKVHSVKYYATALNVHVKHLYSYSILLFFHMPK